jgi:hypothetical protein
LWDAGLAEVAISTAGVAAGELFGPVGVAFPSVVAAVDTSTLSPVIPVFPHHFAAIVTFFLCVVLAGHRLFNLSS